jgi:hypothetical protein
MRALSCPIWLKLALLLVLSAPAAAAEVADLPSALGGTQRVWYDAPANPWALAILFMGGDGNAGLTPEGGISRGGNFLVRTRQLWLTQGIAVLIPDKPAGLPELYGHRLSPGYARDIATLVGYARTRSRAPIWLIGTSQGSNAVATGAASLTHGEIAGAVFSSSVTQPGGRAQMTDTVFGARLSAINVPSLVVAHQDDGCRLTPPADAPRLRAALTGAPRTEIMLFAGGNPPRSGPCEAMAQHGYFGIEQEVVARIAAWMRGR